MRPDADRELKIYGSAWFPADEPIAGFLYGIDQDGNQWTHATGDLEYHEMVVDTIAKLGPGVQVDPKKYELATEGWSTEQALMIEDPHDGWTVE